MLKNAEAWMLFIIAEIVVAAISRSNKVDTVSLRELALLSCDKCELINFAFCAQRPVQRNYLLRPFHTAQCIQIKEKKQRSRELVERKFFVRILKRITRMILHNNLLEIFHLRG